MDCWIYVLEQIGVLTFGLLSVLALFDAKDSIGLRRKLWLCLGAVIFGFISWWLM